MFVPIDRLEPITIGKASAFELLTQLKFGRKGDLARVLTFHKINSKLANVFYAMQTSRTDFYAYQFKPVYKFIESANGRILIADEVGLGKTIEAGLIWQEVRARSDARTLLVVCPSMLREKWKAELRNRFGVQAQVYDGAGFLSILKDFEEDGRSYQCAAICSMQGLRRETVTGAIDDFAKAGLEFDLVIVDEAHYMRNVKTQTHQLGKSLSIVADNMLLLTATPLQLKVEELFRLLSLLDPDEYDNQYLFENRLEANEPVVMAQNALRRIPADLDAAREHLHRAQRSRWFSGNPLMNLAIERVKNVRSGAHSDLVEASRVVENLNLMNSSISRTRKREVQEWKVIRKARVLRLRYSEHEMNFYLAVTDAVRRQISQSGNAGFEAFVLMMPQRQVASCIPAMVEYYRNRDGDEETLYELGWSELEGDSPISERKLNSEIDTLVREWVLDYPDTKYTALVQELHDLFIREPDTKIIIFSYFKKAISYLFRRLAADGLAAYVIQGDVPMEERLQILDAFRDRADIRILISSEVGSEGLDLQFCRVIINYDLPWNPMRVEQRIGRLDRLGQRAESISIINIAAVGTIEERILERLYERIGIFERSIGDLEPILGDMIHRLERDLLSKRLSSEQERERIEQTAIALEAKRRDEAELEDQGQLFFGNSDFVTEQIQNARKTGRWITPAEIKTYIEDFFKHRYVGTRLNWDQPEHSLVTIELSNQARNELAFFCRSGDDATTALTIATTATIAAYSSDGANHHTKAEFLTHFHPLVRWITKSYSDQVSPDPFFPSVAVQLRSSKVLPGTYVFAVERWRFSAIQDEPRIAYAMVGLRKEKTVDPLIAEEVIQEILSEGEDWPHAERTADVDLIPEAVARCESLLTTYRDEAFQTFERKMEGIYQRKKAHREGYLARRQELIQKSIERLENRLIWEDNAQTPASIRGQQTKLEKLTAKVDLELSELDKKSRAIFEFTDVLAGICRIKK